MINSRAGESICTFTRSLDFRSIDTKIIRAVHEEIQFHVSDKDRPLPLRADDDLFRDLRLDEDDIDLDIVPAIAERTGRSLENYETNPFWHRTNTVGGLVRFLNFQPLTMR